METLTISMNGNVNATLGNVVGLDTIYDTVLVQLAMSLNTGTGDSKANQMFTDQRTLAPGASIVTDLVTFSGSNDKVGNPLSMANIKFLYIYNYGTVPGQGANNESQTLILGGSPAGARGWTSVVNGTVTLNGTSGWLLWDPGASGYAVPSGSGNNLFKITNPSGSASVQYNMLVVGATS